MKKLCFLLCLFIVVALSGCGFVKKHYACDIENVQTVQIVRYSGYDDATDQFEYSVLHEITDCTSFLEQLTSITATEPFFPGDPPVLEEGEVIIYIRYRNNDYSFVRNYLQLDFQDGAAHHSYLTFDKDALNTLLSDYVPSSVVLTKVQSFSLNDEPYYLGMIEEFPSDKFLGEVSTAEEAVMHAEREWGALYGDKVYRQKPYAVQFDKQTNVWLVRGTLPKPEPVSGGEIIVKGRVAGILIQKDDGKILAVWHD